MKLPRVLLLNKDQEPPGEHDRVAFVRFVYDGRTDIIIALRPDSLLARSDYFGEQLMSAGPDRGTADMTGKPAKRETQ